MPSETNPPSKALIARRIRIWMEAFMEDPRRKRISTLNNHMRQYRDACERELIKEAHRIAEIMEGKSGIIDKRNMPEGTLTTKVYVQISESLNTFDMAGDIISCSGVYEDLVEHFPDMNKRTVQNFTSKVFRSIVHNYPEDFEIRIAPWAMIEKRKKGRLPKALFRLKDKDRAFTPEQLRTMTNARDTDMRRDNRRSIL